MTGEVTASIEVEVSTLGDSLCRVRLCSAEAQQEMQASLAQLGQLTPVLAWRAETGLEVFDGLKRLRAVRALGWGRLRVDVHAVDSAGAKVRLLRSNARSGLSELEEAWLVRSLYREDALRQGQIAMLLSRHKSWVCRRLAMAEELSDELTASVRLGLISASAVRELLRLPRGNQDAVGRVVARRGLTTRQTARLVESLLNAGEEQWPRGAGAGERDRSEAAQGRGPAAHAGRADRGGRVRDEASGGAPARTAAGAVAAQPRGARVLQRVP